MNQHFSGPSAKQLPHEPDDAYEAFKTWVQWDQNACDTANVLRKHIDEILGWSRQYNWMMRGEPFRRQREQSQLRRDFNKLAEIIDKHQYLSDELIRYGLAYLNKWGVENSKDALKAIQMGVDIQRRGMNLPDYIKNLMQSENDALVERAKHLIESADWSK